MIYLLWALVFLVGGACVILSIAAVIASTRETRMEADASQEPDPTGGHGSDFKFGGR